MHSSRYMGEPDLYSSHLSHYLTLRPCNYEFHYNVLKDVFELMQYKRFRFKLNTYEEILEGSEM